MFCIRVLPTCSHIISTYHEVTSWSRSDNWRKKRDTWAYLVGFGLMQWLPRSLMVCYRLCYKNESAGNILMIGSTQRLLTYSKVIWHNLYSGDREKLAPHTWDELLRQDSPELHELFGFKPWRPIPLGHRPLSLKILYIDFFTLDFQHYRTYIKILMSKIKIVSPYQNVQMRS